MVSDSSLRIQLSISFRPVLILMQPRPAVSVPGGVPESHFRRAGAFEIKAGVVFVSHPNPAMHLDAFVSGKDERIGTAGFGERNERGQIWITFVCRTGCGHYRRTSKLDLHE